MSLFQGRDGSECIQRAKDDVVDFLLDQVKDLVELRGDITIGGENHRFPAIGFAAVFNVLDEGGIPRPAGAGSGETNGHGFIRVRCEDRGEHADNDDQQHTNERLFHFLSPFCIFSQSPD